MGMTGYEIDTIRHDTTRHACRTARRDTLVTTSAARTTRVKGRRHSVDCTWWGGHVHLTFSEIDANPKHKRLNLYTRALLLLRRPPCMLEQARRDTLDKRDTLVTTHTARHACRVVTGRVECEL